MLSNTTNCEKLIFCFDNLATHNSWQINNNRSNVSKELTNGLRGTQIDVRQPQTIKESNQSVDQESEQKCPDTATKPPKSTDQIGDRALHI